MKIRSIAKALFRTTWRNCHNGKLIIIIILTAPDKMVEESEIVKMQAIGLDQIISNMDE